MDEISNLPRVAAHPIEKDYRDDLSESFRHIDRRPFEQVRMQHDRAMQCNNIHTRAPVVGETSEMYSRRLTHTLLPHQVSYPKLQSLQKVGDDLFRDMQAEILREAIDAPRRRGECVPVKVKDRAGREVVEYEGVSNWFRPFTDGALHIKGQILVDGRPRKTPAGFC